jgi:hypothetical protein
MSREPGCLPIGPFINGESSSRFTGGCSEIAPNRRKNPANHGAAPGCWQPRWPEKLARFEPIAFDLAHCASVPVKIHSLALSVFAIASARVKSPKQVSITVLSAISVMTKME